MEKSICIVLCCLMIVLGSQCSVANQELELKGNLIDEIIAESEKININGEDKVVILNSHYCEQIDCDEYFKDYADDVIVYNREDVFMRGIRNHTVIYNIDDDKGSARILVGKYKRHFGKKAEVDTRRVVEVGI